MLGFVLWPCLQLQGMGPGVTEIFGLMGEKLTVSGLDVEEHRHGSDPQQAEAAEKAALRLSWMRRAVVAALAGVAFLWAEFRGDLVLQWAANRSSLWLSLRGSHLSCSRTSVLVKNTSSLLVLSKHSYCFSFVVYSNPVKIHLWMYPVLGLRQALWLDVMLMSLLLCLDTSKVLLCISCHLVTWSA